MADTEASLHQPRILCLHGGGTNARIFRSQCRVLSRYLEPYFRLAYAEAPHPSAPGPDVVTVYAEDGPFKRWLRWLPSHDPIDSHQAVKGIDTAIKAAMDADDKEGADGPWVGLLGFSQGAKIAVSLLFRQQQRALRRAKGEEVSADDGIYDGWKFAVALAGRAPLVNLEPGIVKSTLLCDPAEVKLTEMPDLMEVVRGEHILRLPSIHVHGLNDPGLEWHQELFDQYMDPECTRLVRWDGGHRVVLKGTDVQPVVNAIVDVAKETGAL
ncbi:citrinin biosynthesis oxidoreductase CtnB [Xylaria sp. CBS 124048]|nr:citrinin biosynthesis oxidoreductase CtnB [Xylaria sp. CBS 124048]